MATVAARGVGFRTRSPQTQSSGASDNSVSQREDLANFISMITRDETPFMSSIGKTKATAIYHEWQTDELNAPGYSVVTEGTDYIEPSGASTSASRCWWYRYYSRLITTFAVTGPEPYTFG